MTIQVLSLSDQWMVIESGAKTFPKQRYDVWNGLLMVQ
jgi:hypothetical protein